MNETLTLNGNKSSQNLPSWITPLFFAWFSTTSIIIVTLNSGICLLFWTQRRLRIKGNLFFVNLAIADILVGFVAIPWKLLQYKFILSPTTPTWLDSLATVVDYVLSLSFLSICALTYDRYLAIIYPLTYPANMAFKNTWKRLSLIWCLPCLNFFRLIWIISPRMPRENYSKACGIFLFSVMVIGTGGIVFAYIRIFRAARFQEHHKRDLKPCVKRKQRIKFTKAIRSCLGVTICFICCWLPRGSFLIARHFYSASPPYEYDLLTFGLMCLSPVLNPIIYSICNRDVRRALKVILWKRSREKARLKKETLRGSFSQRTVGTTSSRETYELSHHLIYNTDTMLTQGIRVYTDNHSNLDKI